MTLYLLEDSMSIRFFPYTAFLSGADLILVSIHFI